MGSIQNSLGLQAVWSGRFARVHRNYFRASRVKGKTVGVGPASSFVRSSAPFGFLPLVLLSSRLSCPWPRAAGNGNGKRLDLRAPIHRGNAVAMGFRGNRANVKFREVLRTVAPESRRNDRSADRDKR